MSLRYGVLVGVPFVIGALSPSEAMRAVTLGAGVVKLFPRSLGGPSYLRALRGPFPDLAFMPTGGVSPGNVHDWLDAGACCVGAGSELVSGDAAEITARAAAFVDAAGARA